MQHHIFFHDHIGHSPYEQQGMIKGFFSLPFFLENLFRKIHEVFEIMDAATGDQIIPLRQVQPPDQVFQQTRVHFAVVDKPYGLSFAPVLNSLLDLLNNISRNIFLI